jgi:hypothetical protein
LIAGNPEGESIIEGAILADAADGAVILSGLVEWERIIVVGGVIHDLEAGGLFEDFAGGVGGDGAFEFGGDRNGMSAVNGDAYTGDTGAERGVVHDFAALVLEFHFFLGVAVGQEGIDMRRTLKAIW